MGLGDFGFSFWIGRRFWVLVVVFLIWVWVWLLLLGWLLVGWCRFIVLGFRLIWKLVGLLVAFGGCKGWVVLAWVLVLWAGVVVLVVGLVRLGFGRRFRPLVRFGSCLQNMSLISFCTLLPSLFFLPTWMLFGVGLGGLLVRFGPISAAVAPTQGVVGWGHSWRPIWSGLERVLWWWSSPPPS